MLCEGGFDEAELARVEAAGYDVIRWRRRNLFFGGTNVVEVLPDGTLSDRSVSHAVVGRDVQLGRDPQGVVTVDLATGERIDSERAIESGDRGTEESGA